MDAKTPTLKQQPAGLLPGIYFGLDEAAYHADPALGSGDMRRLALSPPDYWWGSPLNPAREPDDDTPARLRGRAMHKLVLEGETAFDRLFRRSPHTEDMTPAEKSAATKALKAKLPANVSILPGRDYDRIAIAGAMITRNPKLATAFKNGVSEVSVFWDKVIPSTGAPSKSRTVRCKARFDYLKPRGIGDLKSITNWKGIDFRRACIEAIANYRYDMQAAHYLEARARMPALEDCGAVHGGPFDDKLYNLLEAIVAERNFAFQFVFFQAADAPVTYSVIVTPAEANPIMEQARGDLMRAAENYLAFMDTFGPNEIWLTLDDPHELPMESMPAWYARRL